jgi:hypothetical protein
VVVLVHARTLACATPTGSRPAESATAVTRADGPTLAGVDAGPENEPVESGDDAEGPEVTAEVVAVEVDVVDAVEVVEITDGEGVVEAVEAIDIVEVREPSELDRIQDDLDGVERALQALDDGSYGNCQACGTAIADELLATAPTARFCAEHEVAAGA